MIEDILCFIQFYYLLPLQLHFETSEGFRTKLTNTMYNFFPLFFSSFALRFHHCTSVIPRTPIYRAFKLTNSYLQIYLVKPWLISTVFKPTLQLFKDKTLEYLKILNSKKNNNKKKIEEIKNLLVSFFDPKTLFTKKGNTCRYFQLLFNGLIPVFYLSTLKYCFWGSFHHQIQISLISNNPHTFCWITSRNMQVDNLDWNKATGK